MRLGWRNALRRPGRLLTTAIAFALAVLVIILIQGFAAGLYDTYSAMVSNTAVDLWISEQGVKGVANSMSLLRADLADEMVKVPGVKAVTPLYSVPVIAEVGGRKVPLSLYGYDLESGLGGPWALAAGRRPAGPEEIALDRALAQSSGLGLDSTFTMYNQGFRVVGLTEQTNSFMSAAAFADRVAVGKLIKAPDRASFLLINLEPGAEIETVKKAVPKEFTIHTPEHLRSDSEEFLTRTMGSPLNLLLTVSFLVGLAVISLTTYAGILEREGEYGVLRALGMSTSSLVTVVMTEVLVSAAVGITVGTILAALLASILGLWLPAYPIVIGGAGLVRTVLLAMAMGVISALVPLKRLLAMDPASVFRV